MVLICGYGVIAPTDLPHYGAIEYVIKPAQRDVKMLRRTKLLEKCSEVCLPEEYVAFIPQVFAEKICVCANLDVLKAHLEGKDTVQPRVTDNTTIESVETGTAEAQVKRKRQVARKTVTPVAAKYLEETNNALTDSIKQLETENATLKNAIQQLEEDNRALVTNAELYETEVTALQQNIMQKESTVTDLELRIQQLEQEVTTYKQDTDTENLRAKLEEAVYAVDMYKGETEELRIKVAELTESSNAERKQFEADKEQYAEMIEQYETERKYSALTEILTTYMPKENERPFVMPQLNADTAGVYTLCFAEDTPYVYDDIRNTITAGSLDAVIADFSGNRCLAARLKLSTSKGVVALTAGANIADIVVMRGKTHIIPAEAVCDIQLLTYDWAHIVTQLKTYAQGRPVYILLGNIAAFSTQYVAMLLAQEHPTNLVGCATPDSLLNLYWRLQQLPPQRLSLTLMDYVPGTLKGLLDALVTRYNVTFVNKGAHFHIENLNGVAKR